MQGNGNSHARSGLIAALTATALAGAGLGFSTGVLAEPQPNSQAKSGDAGAVFIDPVAAAPDPPALRSAEQIVLTFRHESRRVRLVGARRVTLRSPRVTPRNAGRFALELLSGPVLVERVRFDFPLLGADELAGRPLEYKAPPRFETKVVVDYSVFVPDSSRFSQARLVDRAIGTVLKISWPPEVAADGGLAGRDGGTTARIEDGAPADSDAPTRAELADASTRSDGR